jgi:pyruvate/2-oxoglutarate dehydrogenase complex dihydrolipoamide acyltransferase (E2) component
MKPRALLTNESSSCKEVPMGELSLVVGAGVIGSRVAGMLDERGDRVRVVSRHGSGPAGVAADAADAGAMARLAEGASVIYNCVNPPYHRWPADWPPIAASVLAAAERSGAVLVTLSNLYGYGPRVPGGYDEAHPMTEATPQVGAPSENGHGLKASPVAKRVASDKGVDLEDVAGTGPGGRITKDDVLASADGGNPQQLTADERNISNPDWSPDGNSLVFGRLQAFGRVFSMVR